MDTGKDTLDMFLTERKTQFYIRRKDKTQLMFNIVATDVQTVREYLSEVYGDHELFHIEPNLNKVTVIVANSKSKDSIFTLQRMLKDPIPVMKNYTEMQRSLKAVLKLDDIPSVNFIRDRVEDAVNKYKELMK